MRRILLPILAVAAAYCAYLTTIPSPAVIPVVSKESISARVTREMDLPARNFYAACLGKFGDENEARIEAARLARRGAAGWVMEDESVFAVVGAVYEAQGDALSVCRRLEAAEDLDAEVMLCAADALRIRVTAGEDQISAMESVLNMLEEIPPELNSLSYSLDGGDMSADTARTLIGVLVTRAVEADDGLRLAAGETGDKFCLSLMEISGEMRAALEFMAADSDMGTMELSSAMKNAAISAMLGISDMMDKLR